MNLLHQQQAAQIKHCEKRELLLWQALRDIEASVAATHNNALHYEVTARIETLQKDIAAENEKQQREMKKN